MYDTADYYLRFYQKFLFDQWDNLGPKEYVTVLIFVGVTGWIMMRKAARL